MAKTSRLFLTEVQEAYLTWLLTPDDSKAPKTKKDWAELHDVHINTLGLWEKNKIFKERWELGVKGMAQSPERTQALLDALYTKGVSGDVKSAELYLKATGFMQQVQTVNINNTSSVKELTDEELHSMILELSQKKQPTISITKKEVEEEEE
jgi:hypothetical protein